MDSVMIENVKAFIKDSDAKISVFEQELEALRAKGFSEDAEYRELSEEDEDRYWEVSDKLENQEDLSYFARNFLNLLQDCEGKDIEAVISRFRATDAI